MFCKFCQDGNLLRRAVWKKFQSKVECYRGRVGKVSGVFGSLRRPFRSFKCYATKDQYVIWCLKQVVENSHKIMRCYDKEDDEAHLCSYRDDILDIAYNSRKEGKLLRIYFDEILISEYDKDMTRGTLYPMTLKGKANPWNDMIVIVETIPELCGDEVQSKEVEGYIEEIKNALITQRFVYDIRETISITKASFV